MQDRLKREQEFFDELVAKQSTTRSMLDRFSKAFYEKGSKGRLWAPVWESVNLRDALVLDYGCGDGEFSQVLANRGAHVTGIDISPKIIEQAEIMAVKAGLNGYTPKFMVADAHHTPFEDASFDFVFGNGALHHLDLPKAWAEVSRVLKPGGWAIFQEPMHDHPLLWSLRRLTPETHTADERPLSLSDIETARGWFKTCRHREHFVFAVLAAPTHLLGDRFALSVVGGIDRFDGALMRVIPGLRRFAWLTVLEMQK